MDLPDQIAKLQALREAGALMEVEFALAKRDVLHGASQPPSQGHPHGLSKARNGEDNSLGKAANRYVNFQVVMTIIGLIVFLIFLFSAFLPAFKGVHSGMPRF